MNKETINTQEGNNEDAARWEAIASQQPEAPISHEIKGGYHARKEDEASVKFFIDTAERGDCSVYYTGDGIKGKEEALLSEYLHVMDEEGFNDREAVKQNPFLKSYMEKFAHDLAFIDAKHASVLDGSEESRKYLKNLDNVIGYCDTDFATEEDKALVSDFMSVLDSKGAALSIMMDSYKQLYGDSASPIPEANKVVAPTATENITPISQLATDFQPFPEEEQQTNNKESARALEKLEDSLGFLHRSEYLSDELLNGIKKTAEKIDQSLRDNAQIDETRYILNKFKKELDDYMGSILSLDRSNQDVVEVLSKNAAYIDEDMARRAATDSDRCQGKIDDAKNKYQSRQEWIARREDALRKMQQLQDENAAILRRMRNY